MPNYFHYRSWIDPRSPDLNIIEAAWDHLDWEWNKRQPRSKEELWNCFYWTQTRTQTPVMLLENLEFHPFRHLILIALLLIMLLLLMSSIFHLFFPWFTKLWHYNMTGEQQRWSRSNSYDAVEKHTHNRIRYNYLAQALGFQKPLLILQTWNTELFPSL